ncbi:hypothetical protein QFC22_006147 [Naganishia vaughanmartiniae]|uniref:Uncharacterized protein n=1 Tax=Naganishia vaughanmartiniae TaxID=1424756 RepID=A0ACC2WQD8_9TREE|nr:hypothetical protein QFC22_006147 [Naganishia vaughanmartiniae]
MPELFSFDLSSTQTLILSLPLLYFLIPYFLSLLTPKPLPGIPYRRNRQYPIIGDGLDAGKWLTEQKTITQWFDGCIQAFMYTGPEKAAQWGILGGKERTAKQMMRDFDGVGNGLQRDERWEGICQMMFGLGNEARQVVVTDVHADIAFGKGYNLLPEYISSLSSTTSPSASPSSERHEIEFPYDPNAMYHATEGLLTTLPLFSAFPKISIFLQSFQPKFRKDKQLVHAFIYEQIREARERAIVRGDERAELADSAIDQALLKVGTVDALAEPELRDEVLLFLAAGQETTARTLSWGMKMLARAPDVQKKLKKELTEAGLMEREFTYQDLLAEKVPYLEATANEILRLAGTAAGVSRIATRDTTVLGKLIPKGTTLYLPLTLMATLPMEDLAGDPSNVGAKDAKWPGATLKSFEPERWLDDQGMFDASVGVQSLPFSAGQRGCFGKALAVSSHGAYLSYNAAEWIHSFQMLELKTMLAKINLAFFLDSIPADYDNDEFVEYVSRKPKVALPGIAPLPQSSQRSRDEGAELEAFERTLRDRINDLQTPTEQNNQAWTTALPNKFEALESNFESYLRMARRTDRKREREMERLMEENEKLQLLLEESDKRVAEMTVEIADLRQDVSGGPRLPMELLITIAGFLAGSNAYGSLANFNLASKAVRTETRPVLNETMMLDSKEYGWIQRYELDQDEKEIFRGTSTSQHESWRQVKYVVVRKSVDEAESDPDLSQTLFHKGSRLFPNLQAILKYGLDQREILHIRKPTSRDTLTNFLKIPLWWMDTWGPSAALDQILLDKHGEITGPIKESDHYWFRMDWDVTSEFHLTINDLDAMRQTLQHIWRILPPPNLMKAAKAHYEANYMTIDPPEPRLDSDYGSILFMLNGPLDHLVPFVQALEEMHLRNPDLEAVEIKWADCRDYHTDEYLALLQPIADVYRKLWSSGIKPTLSLQADRMRDGVGNWYNPLPDVDDPEAGYFGTHLRHHVEDGGEGFIMETLFRWVAGRTGLEEHHDITYPHATQIWKPVFA